jgi:hypothetical protein
MAKLDPAIQDHQEWIGFVKPTGLVVSAPALVRAGAILNRRDIEGQSLLIDCVEERIVGSNEDPVPCIADFRKFAESVLGWNFSTKGYAGTAESPIPSELEELLPDYGETLRPDFAVREIDPKDGVPPWQLLVRVLNTDEDLDRIVHGNGRLEASAHGRMERLLRQKGILAGLLFNGRVLRLLSAPRGESSGWLDFKVEEMILTAGRPISTAMRLLLSQARLLNLPRAQRFASLLEDSRKFQNEVSERLAEQVLHALYELLRGLQGAHDASKGELLRQTLAECPEEIYRAQLTVILRLVFLLYSEERDMLPKDETFIRYYSLAGLYERLREDAALYPDTMDQRYGAWPQLLVIFRMIHDGAELGAMQLPKRHGVLFDPDRFPFLEGRPLESMYQEGERIEPPLVPDGTIYRALEKLLVLNGERISYRALDVEQIGSVYETMMGFRIETATGCSVAIKAPKKHGAPTTIDLDALLEEPAAKRAKWIQDHTDRKITDKVKKAVSAADAIEDLHAALLPVIDIAATPDLVPKGAMVLQPSEERRRSGSHYTPRILTEPIVRTTLEPILKNLRGDEDSIPTPERILGLKICDPAMGSGAFLVEACRQLGDALIESWHAYNEVPEIPADEDEVVFARRLIAQRCLYGVDKNPVAVDLAKVSLWLVTLARDHALTFVDHALRHGDSLVGLSKKQIESFHWDVETSQFQSGFETMQIREHVAKIFELRQLIREADDNVTDHELRDLWDEAQIELGKVRIFGDLVLAAFFEGKKTAEREAKRSEYSTAVVNEEAEQYRDKLMKWRDAKKPFVPFHWEVEFPEVFERGNPGFDAMVGNPPFAAGHMISSTLGNSYLHWVLTLHEESNGKADLVAHFFRRGFKLINNGGTLGLIATNTISQGHSRATSLCWISKRSGEIYSARKRVKWPGLAAVTVSVLHIIRGSFQGPKHLDEHVVDTITAFLFHRGGNDDPAQLEANAKMSFKGPLVLGMGFTFDDNDKEGVASPVSEMRNLIEKEPKNQEVIFPYIGGDEVNKSPSHTPQRYVINFGDRGEEECRQQWPDLMAIIEAKVKPERMKLRDNSDGRNYKKYWWRFGRLQPALQCAIVGLERVLVACLIRKHHAFCFLPANTVYAFSIGVFAVSKYSGFSALQCRVHEVWSFFLGSTLEDRPIYILTSCFQTFPFPENWEASPALELAGKEYYEFRAALMDRNNEGLTKTYNRFHDPDELDPEVLMLRELHAAMDRAVLNDYGWTDIKTDCEFNLEYEIDEKEGSSRKKKPWRYRWPNEVRNEVLARLLGLNAKRAKEGASSGAAITKKFGKNAKAKLITTQTEIKDFL